MKRYLHLFAAAIATLLMMVSCGEDPIEEPTVEPLGAPKGLQLTKATTTTLTLRWDAVVGATDYTYKYKDTGGKMHISDNTDQVSITIGGLTPGKEYMFAVRANNEAGGGAYSEWLTVATSTEDSGGDEGGDEGGDGDDTGGDNGGDTGDDNDNDNDVTPEDPDNAKWMLPEWENDGVVRAFPGAEGGGMYTTGGRGGTVYHVTNLNDSGTGSFRDAVNKSGARTIVFDVSGTIHLKNNLRIRNGDLTIAGQTAPGDGICIAGGTVQIDADNIIIRYLRFRLGDQGSSLSDGSDAFWGRYHSNIIIDHCSLSWSIDEVGSFYANRNFTMQWCMLSEALRVSVHAKGNHGYGGIWGGKNASFHHNMLAHNDSRNARIDHPNVYDSYLTTHRGHVDYRNNVIYNWGGNSTYGGEGGWWNIIGNYYKPGPASKQRNYFVDAYGKYSGTDVGYGTMYLSGNYHAGSYASSINSDNWSGVYLHDGTGISNASSWKSSKMMPIKADDQTQCYSTTHTAADAYTQVLAHVGCSLSRDSVDERIVGEAKAGTATYKTGSNGSKNGLIDSQSDVGGWPTLSATNEELSKVTDTDGDGMPDWFEKQFGTKVNDATDGNAITLDAEGRYTNLEIYLHYLVREITAAQVEGGSYDALK